MPQTTPFQRVDEQGRPVFRRVDEQGQLVVDPPGTTFLTANPSQIHSGLITGAAKSTGNIGLMGLQWLQYLAGHPVSPTPMGLLPKTEIEAAGGIVPQVAIPAAVGVATGGMSIPAQVLAGGLASGITAAASGASPGATTTAAVAGAAGPEIPNALGPAAKWLRGKARELVSQAIGPKEKEKEALSKVLDTITARRPLALSSEGLLAKFQKDADKANAAFDAILARGSQRIDADAVASKIDDVIESLKINGRFATPEDLVAANQLEQVQAEIRALAEPGSNIAAMSAMRQLKQRYDRIIQGTAKNFNRTLPEASRAEAAQEGFFKIRQGMIEQNPELAQAGKESQIAITPRNILARQETSNISGGMNKIGLGAELGLLGAGVGFGRVEPIVAAATLSILRHALASTPRKLITAATYTTLANAIEKGNLNLALKIAGQSPAILETVNQQFQAVPR